MSAVDSGGFVSIHYVFHSPLQPNRTEPNARHLEDFPNCLSHNAPLLFILKSSLLIEHSRKSNVGTKIMMNNWRIRTHVLFNCRNNSFRMKILIKIRICYKICLIFIQFLNELRRCAIKSRDREREKDALMNDIRCWNLFFTVDATKHP